MVGFCRAAKKEENTRNRKQKYGKRETRKEARVMEGLLCLRTMLCLFLLLFYLCLLFACVCPLVGARKVLVVYS